MPNPYVLGTAAAASADAWAQYSRLAGAVERITAQRPGSNIQRSPAQEAYRRRCAAHTLEANAAAETLRKRGRSEDAQQEDEGAPERAKERKMKIPNRREKLVAFQNMPKCERRRLIREEFSMSESPAAATSRWF